MLATNYGRSRFYTTGFNPRLSIKGIEDIGPKCMPLFYFDDSVVKFQGNELHINYESLFSNNWKVKDCEKKCLFRINFTDGGASITTKDRNRRLMVLQCPVLLNETYRIRLEPTATQFLSKITSNESSIKTTIFNQESELLFPSVCQTNYRFRINNVIYSWRPMLINSDWLLFLEPNQATSSEILLAVFKKRNLHTKVGSLQFVNLHYGADTATFLLTLGYIVHRHTKTPLM